MSPTPGDLIGAALITPTYEITVNVLDDKNLFSNIRAVNNNQAPPALQQPRPASRGLSGFMYEHFTWNNDPGRGLTLRPRLKSEYEIINDTEMDVAARELRNLAQQKGERVPGKKEALAMGEIAKVARGIGHNVRTWKSFNVQNEKNFVIFCSQTANTYAARLFVRGKQRVVAMGIGATHFRAMHALCQEVGIKESQREMAKYRKS